jgi:hypothetical protein
MWRKAWELYYEGFRNLTLGKTLWKLILLKLLVMFVILKGFVFDTTLGTMFKGQEERAGFVLENLIKER